MDKNRFFTVVYEVPGDWRPGDDIMHNPMMTSVSWSHALRDRDEALARAGSAAPTGQQAEPVAGPHDDAVLSSTYLKAINHTAGLRAVYNLAAPTAAEGPSLHNAIMNIQMDESHDAFTAWNAGEREAYKIGHRDARHAAAELANEHEAQKDGATEQDAKDAARYRWLRDVCPEFEAMTSPWLYDDLDKVIDAAIAAQPKDTTDTTKEKASGN